MPYAVNGFELYTSLLRLTFGCIYTYIIGLQDEGCRNYMKIEGKKWEKKQLIHWYDLCNRYDGCHSVDLNVTGCTSPLDAVVYCYETKKCLGFVARMAHL